MSTANSHGAGLGSVAERASTLLRLRRPEAAERELRGALARDPQHVVSHALLALALISQGAGDEALTEANEAVRLAPDHWYPHCVTGQVLFYAHRPSEALHAAQTALAIDQTQMQVWELLTRVHVDLREWGPATQAARQGLALDPHNSLLASFLAYALGSLGDKEQAMSMAADAVRRDPESSLAHLVQGRTALAFGEPRDAARAFREVLRLDPSMDQARELLVTALKRRDPIYRALSSVAGGYKGSWRLVALLPLIPPVFAVLILIALLHWAMWVAEALTTLRLSRGSYTRLLLQQRELRPAVLSCSVLVGGSALLALGVIVSHAVTVAAGVALLALVTPVQEAFHAGSPLARTILGGWAGLLALTITLSLALSVLLSATDPMISIVILAMWAGLATIWVATAVRRITAKRPVTA